MTQYEVKFRYPLRGVNPDLRGRHAKTVVVNAENESSAMKTAAAIVREINLTEHRGMGPRLKIISCYPVGYRSRK